MSGYSGWRCVGIIRIIPFWCQHACLDHPHGYEHDQCVQQPAIDDPAVVVGVAGSGVDQSVADTEGTPKQTLTKVIGMSRIFPHTGVQDIQRFDVGIGAAQVDLHVLE